jgi:hypothetical protein
MPDDRRHLRIHELLRDERAELGVALVVLAHHAEEDGHPPDHQPLRVGLVDGERHAVLVILALVRDGTRQRAGDTEGDYQASEARGAGRRFGLAAGGDEERGNERALHSGAGFRSFSRIQPRITR